MNVNDMERLRSFVETSLTDLPAVKITITDEFLARDPADYNDFERAMLKWWLEHRDRQHDQWVNTDGSTAATWRASPPA